MKRIYIAGAYSADNILDIGANIKKGLDMSTYLLMHGYFTHCPFLDFQYLLNVYGDGLTVDILRNNSMSWLEVSDAVLVLCGYELSAGTKAEIKRANELDIPVYYDRVKMMGEVK